MRPFKIVLPGSKAAIFRFAETLSIAEKWAQSQAASDVKTEARPLTEAEYKTVDFKADSVTRVPGGKEDATLTPYMITVGDESEVKLSSSLSNAEKFLMAEVARKTGATVDPVPAEEYASIDWSSVETIAKEQAAPAAAEASEEGDADKQTDSKLIPGME